MLVRQVRMGLSLAAVAVATGCCCHKHACAPATPAVVGASPCCPGPAPCAPGAPAVPAAPAPVGTFSPPPGAIGLGR